MTRLFRKQLIIAILPVLILAALSTIWTTRVSERHMIAQLESELTVESELHAAGVGSLLDERLAELRAIAASPITRTGDSTKILPYLTAETTRLSNHFEGLYLGDLKGNVRGSRGEQFSVVQRDYFPRMRQGETVVTDEIVSLATEHPIILMVVPVYDEAGKHSGAIGGSILVSSIHARVESAVEAEQGFAVLVDSRGKVLTPKASEPSPLQTAFIEWLSRVGITNDTGTGDAPFPAYEARLDGEEFLVAHRPVPQTGWQFYLAKRATIATKPAKNVRWANLLFSGLVLVIAFLVAYYFTGRLLGPLSQLLDVHRRFGQGDYQARIAELPDDEIGELGRAFNSTAEQLAERQSAQKAAERSLRESEARLRLLSDNVDDAIFLHDLDGKLIDVNPAACESLGYSCDELLSLNITAVLAKPDESKIRQAWKTISQRQEKIRRLEVAHRRKDNTTFPVEMSAVPLLTAQGMRILVSARDVSERRRAEDQMANFFRLSEDMMCIADEQGIFRQMSPAFEQVLGYKLEELVGRPYLEFVHPDDREKTKEEGRKIYEARGNINFENRYRCKDGTYKWLQWRPFREIYEGMIYAIARDVTESHRTTRLMQQTSSAAMIGGWEYDFATNTLFWTDETYRLHDLSPDTYDPTPEKVLTFYTEKSRNAFLAAAERAFQDGRPYDMELEMVTATGRNIWVHVLGRVDMEDGKPVRTYGSFQDITERKAAEEERRQLDDQLREFQRIESIGILAGGIAHDFNNLLTGVLGFTRLAAAEAEATGSETMRSHLQQIEQCSLRAADLCKQLLAYAGKGQFTVETIDLSALVRETAGLVESIVGSHSKLELMLDDDLPLVEGDPTQLRQVVMNLVTNAFDALGPHPGTVKVTTGVREFLAAPLQASRVRSELPPGRHVFVEVSDNGVGMKEETLARVFDPFFTTKFAGRGLGLAAVQGIIRSHHGAIIVTSAPNVGTTFTIVLPASDDDGEPRIVSDNNHRDTPISARADSGGTILLMDDESAVLSLAQTALERGGFRVLTALNGPAGIALYDSHADEIIAVIVDITMPGMNGIDVLRALRAKNPDLPLLPMSGYTEKSLEAATTELKLSTFVEKPFRLGDLVNAVHGALAGREKKLTAPS